MRVSVLPQTELEEHARAAYVRRYARAPEPRVINVDAVIGFSAPRAFIWSGVRYRAPPLSFPQGVRLFVMANALRDLRTQNASPGLLQNTVRLAGHVLRRLVRPARLRDRVGRWPWRFLAAEPLEMEGLLRWLLEVPDARTFPPPTTATTLDFMDHLTEFVCEFPAWVGRDGLPLSWAGFIYGSRHLLRARARQDLRLAMALHPTSEWNAELRQTAGWN